MLDEGFYEAKGLGFWNCNVVTAFGETCGRTVANSGYDIEAHMRRAHPFKYHDDTCDDLNLYWQWDYIHPDDPPIDGDDGCDTSAMILLCGKCFVMITFTTIRPGNLAAGVL